MDSAPSSGSMFATAYLPLSMSPHASAQDFLFGNSMSNIGGTGGSLLPSMNAAYPTADGNAARETVFAPPLVLAPAAQLPASPTGSTKGVKRKGDQRQFDRDRRQRISTLVERLYDEVERHHAKKRREPLPGSQTTICRSGATLTLVDDDGERKSSTGKTKKPHQQGSPKRPRGTVTAARFYGGKPGKASVLRAVLDMVQDLRAEADQAKSVIDVMLSSPPVTIAPPSPPQSALGNLTRSPWFLYASAMMVCRDAMSRRVLDVNPAFERVTGFARESMVGRLMPDDLISFIAQYQLPLSQSYIQSTLREMLTDDHSLLTGQQPVTTRVRDFVDAQHRPMRLMMTTYVVHEGNDSRHLPKYLLALGSRVA